MKPATLTWTIRDLAFAALAIGLVCGAVFAATDLMMNRATSSAAQSAQLITASAAVGGIMALPIIVGLVLIIRRIPQVPSIPVLLGVCAGLGIQLAFLLTLSVRGLEYTAVVPWLVAFLVYNLLQHGDNSRIFTRALVLALCAAILVPMLMGYGGLRGGKLRVLFTILILLLPAILLQAAAVRFRLPTFVLLILAFAAVQWTGTRSRGWRENAVAATGLESIIPETSDAPASPAAEPDPAVKPNVVLIVLDTTRVDRLGCYGHTGNLTPRLDAFAKECTVYEDAISSAPWTVPSHASLFTGLYTVTHGCDAIPHRWLDSGFVTLAEMLHTTGYDTAALVANGYVYACNLLQGVTQYLELDLSSGHRSTRMYKWMSKIGAPHAWADQGARESVTSLSQWLNNRRDNNKPFYLFVNLMEAHWPLCPPYAERKEQLMPGMGYLEATRIAGRFYGPKWTAGEKRTQRDEEAVRRLYNSEIAYQDSQLGDLLEVLRARTDFDNTLVIITADHGEHQGEHGQWDHVFSVGEALIHVPLLIRYPAKFPKGERVSGQCQLVDIVPTVFDVLGTPCPVPDLPGRTIVPQHFAPRKYTYAEVQPYYGHLERLSAVTGLKRDIAEFLGYHRTVRTDQYKFIWSDRGKRQLYDISVDPQEAHDLIHDLPDIAAQLEAHMHEWWNAQPQYEPREIIESGPTPEDTLRGLRGLGYVK